MSYNDLPVYRGEFGYPKDIMDKTFEGIKQNIFACDPAIISMGYPKLEPWCKYTMDRLSKSVPLQYVPEKMLVDKPYDEFFRDLPEYAHMFHILMMLMLVFVFIGIVGNMICLPWFNSKLNRSGATLYLTFAVIFDILYLIGFTILYPYQFSSPNITIQFNRYHNYTSHLIPTLLPCVESFSLISLWLVIALLIDRLPIAAETISPQVESLLDPKIRESINRGRSRCRYSIYMLLMVFFFSVYTAIRSFSYYRAIEFKYTQFAIKKMLLTNNIFKITLIYAMRPIVEILLPGLLIVWYLILIRDKKYGFKKFQNLKRRQHEIQNEKITDQTSGLSNYCIATDNNTTARTSAMMNMSILDCKRWSNEFIVSKMTLNIALYYLFYLIFQTIAYFICIDVKSDRLTNLVFRYLSIISTTIVISLKPIVYLLSSKAVIKELHRIQKSNIYIVHRNNINSGWLKHWQQGTASQEADRILT